MLKDIAEITQEKHHGLMQIQAYLTGYFYPETLREPDFEKLIGNSAEVKRLFLEEKHSDRDTEIQTKMRN